MFEDKNVAGNFCAYVSEIILEIEILIYLGE